MMKAEEEPPIVIRPGTGLTLTFFLPFCSSHFNLSPSHFFLDLYCCDHELGQSQHAPRIAALCAIPLVPVRMLGRGIII